MNTNPQNNLSKIPQININQTNSDEVSLKELILKLKEWGGYLLSQWKLITLIGFIGSFIGFYYASTQKTYYKAELTFALEDEKSGGGVGGALGLASQFGFDLGSNGGGAFAGDNLLLLMKSRSMVEKALLSTVRINGNTQTLAEFYITYNNLRKNWDKDPELKDIQFPSNSDRSNFTLKQDSILGKFQKAIIDNMLILDKLDKKLSIIVVRVRSENELFSQYFTEVLAKVVSDFYIETKTKKSVQNVNMLQHQTDSVRRVLNYAIGGVALSVDANPNANLARQILGVPSQRKQVDVQANQAILTELVKNLEVSKVSLRKETPLIQIIDRPILPLEKEKLSVLKGLSIGGLLGGFMAIVIIIAVRLFKMIMA
jgi:hypothetical protein